MRQFIWALVAVSLAQQLTAANESQLMLTIVAVLIIFPSPEASYDSDFGHFWQNCMAVLTTVLKTLMLRLSYIFVSTTSMHSRNTSLWLKKECHYGEVLKKTKITVSFSWGAKGCIAHASALTLVPKFGFGCQRIIIRLEQWYSGHCTN